MTAADPTFPLLPIASILAGVTMLLVLLTNVVRQNWNLGVAFLSFSLLLENVFYNAVGTIVWSDNADIKLYVYCDIGKHMW